MTQSEMNDRLTKIVPKRKNGDGSIVVDGSSGEYDWEGFYPIEKMPYCVNPKEGEVAPSVT